MLVVETNPKETPGIEAVAKGQGLPSGCPRASCIFVGVERFNLRPAKQLARSFPDSTTCRLGIPEIVGRVDQILSSAGQNIRHCSGF
jgi:hypothetical protein